MKTKVASGRRDTMMKKTLFIILYIILVAGPAYPVEVNFIKDWLVLGTFAGADPETLPITYHVTNERELAPSPGEFAADREWRAEKIDESGRLDFNETGFIDLPQNIS